MKLEMIRGPASPIQHKFLIYTSVILCGDLAAQRLFLLNYVEFKSICRTPTENFSKTQIQNTIYQNKLSIIRLLNDLIFLQLHFFLLFPFFSECLCFTLLKFYDSSFPNICQYQIQNFPSFASTDNSDSKTAPFLTFSLNKAIHT